MGTELVKCFLPSCNNLVDVSQRKSRRPGDKVFCSNEHRIKFHSLNQAKSHTPKHRKLQGASSTHYKVDKPKACKLEVSSCLYCPLKKCNLRDWELSR